MFIQGVARVDNIITEAQRLEMKSAILDAHNRKAMHLEDDDTHYKNSYGASSLPVIDNFYDILTPIVESVTGLKLAKENCYSRIYNVGSTLNKHIDREGLDITVSLQIENTTGLPQPVFCENYSGGVMEAALNNGDFVIIRGRDLHHWRNPMESLNPEGQLICSFFHWRIVGNDTISKPNFISPTACNSIIKAAEAKGFEKSQVIKDGKNTHDDYSRSSSTMWFEDTWHISDMLKNIIPEVANLRVEGWQLVKYDIGEEFKAHFDCLNIEKDRLFTAIIYLNDNFTGGETHFPNKQETIYPEQGKLIMWKNLSAGKCDDKSLHSGNKIISGTKYVLVTWLLDYK